MRMKNLFGALLLFFCTIGFASCLNDDELRDKTETINVEISALTCISGSLFGYYPIEGMLVKIENNPDFHFLNFNEINGFTYQRGYEYKLQIERITLANPPADGSLYAYNLIKELSKQKGEGVRNNIHLYVSAETGTYKWGDITQDIPAPGMKIREKADDEWIVVPFNKISDFQYDEGYEYELSVEKITLSAKPTEERWQTTQYVLSEIISKVKAE